MTRYFLILCISVLLSGAGCRQSAGSGLPPLTATKPFFDLRGYIQSQIRTLANVKTVDKKVNVNGKTEQKSGVAIDLEKELSLFAQSDINRPAWLDKYHADTTVVENDPAVARVIRYRTDNEQLKTKELKIFMDRHGAPVEIRIVNADQSMFSDWRQDLMYKAGLGYHISNRQKFIFLSPSMVAIDASFISGSGDITPAPSNTL